MYRFLRIIILICFLSGVLSAQERTKKDKGFVTLVDGSTYIGEVVYENDDTIALEIITKDVISIDKRFTKKVLTTKDEILLFHNGRYHQTKGFMWGFHWGFNFAEFTPSNHLEFLFGHRLNKKLTLGGGFGFEFNTAEVAGFRFDTQFTPLFGMGRYYLTHSRSRFFVYSRMGYGFAAEPESANEDHTGGWQLQNGIGIQFSSKNSSKFTLALGHHYQKTNGSESFIDALGNEINTEFDILISRVIFKIGFEIK